MASPGEEVTVFTYPYLSAGAPARGEAKGLIEGSNNYINNCYEKNLYEYNGKCISQCPNGYYEDDNNNIKYKCEFEKCLE